MINNLFTQHQLIKSVAATPFPLEDPETGAALAKELAGAILTITDDAIVQRDADTLYELMPNLWKIFNAHHPPSGPVVDWIDLYEYLYLMSGTLETGDEDPSEIVYFVEYRRRIETELDEGA